MTCAHELSLTPPSRAIILKMCHTISIAIVLILHVHTITQSRQHVSNEWCSTRARGHRFEYACGQHRVCVTHLLVIRLGFGTKGSWCQSSTRYPRAYMQNQYLQPAAFSHAHAMAPTRPPNTPNASLNACKPDGRLAQSLPSSTSS